MAKKDRPAIENPLANIGLDDIVRNITASGNIAGVDKKDLDKEPDTPKNTGKPRRGSRKLFEDNLAQYTGINEQGIAIWLPKDVKKKAGDDSRQCKSQHSFTIFGSSNYNDLYFGERR